MYRRILLGLDHRGDALRAFPIVAELARQASGEIHVVTVATGRRTGLAPATANELERLMAEAAGSGLTIRADVVGRRASVAAALAGVARADGADLVALGSRGRSTLVVLRGSVGPSLASMLDTPLLLVHVDGAQLAPWPIRRVLVAVDRHAESEAATAAARDLAAEDGAAVLLVHVPEMVQVLIPPGPTPRMFGYFEDDAVGAAVLDAARQRLAGADTAVSTRLLEGDGTVGTRIAEAAEQWGADVIVVGSRRLTPMGGLLAGSVTRALVRRTRRPVLLAGRPG